MNRFTGKELFELINLLRIDVFMFVYIFGYMLPNVTLNQLVQDKICLNEFKYDPKFCLDLSGADPQFEVQKNKVLEYATSMKNYQTLIATTPGVVLSLFIGYWIDSYPSHLKYLLSAPAVGAIIQAFMVIYDAINFERHPATTLYSFISIGFSGGVGLVFAGTYIYTTRMTPVKYRSVRFSVLEFFAFSGFPVATALGGKILALEPWFANQYRNYIAVFLITIAANSFGIIWIILFLKEEEPVSAQNERSLVKSPTSTSLSSYNSNNNSSTNNNNNLNLSNNNNQINNNNNNNEDKDENEKIINNLNNSINSVLNGSSNGNELLELKNDLTGLGLQVVDENNLLTAIKVNNNVSGVSGDKIKSNGSLTSINTNVSSKNNNSNNGLVTINKSSSRSTSSKTMDLIKDIFTLNNVRSMIKTCCRRRPNNGRLRLWHLMLGMTVALIGHLGEAVIGYQFTQKVYHWDAEYFSYVNSALTVIPSVVQTISPAILIHKFHLHDTTVAGIGCISIMISTIVKGGILESYAYFIAFISGAFSGTLPIAFRSLVSRLIDFNEIGQVYALLACIESCAPMISSIFYSTVFNATIENYPGTVFHAVTLIFFYPLMVILWLDLTRSKWDVQVNNPVIITTDDQEGGNNNSNCGKSIDPTIMVAPPELIIENLIV